MKKFNNQSLSALIKSLASLTIILSFSIITLCACDYGNDSGNISTGNSFKTDPFTPIPGYENDGLVYMNLSNTIYVLFKETTYERGYGYLAPYIKNGHYWEYVDGEFVEIIPSTEFSPNEIWSNLSEEEKENFLDEEKER